MVSATDLKLYRSAGSGLGGAINTSDLVLSANPNNLFANTPSNEAAAGSNYFTCVYLKNTHASENMDEFTWWIDSKDSGYPYTTYRWGFDPTSIVEGYRWSPNFATDGSTTFDSTASSAALQIPVWTCSAWINTSANFASRGYIISKGGEGSDSAGQNDNYSIAMNTDGTIRGGFEEADGTDHHVTSPLAYNDGIPHFILAYYDGTQIALFVDDMTTPVATVSTTASPETSGTNAVVIGRNSRTSANFFGVGWIDECRVWNRAMTDEDERSALKENNIANPTGLVLEKKFGADDAVLVAQTIADKYTDPLNIEWQELEDGVPLFSNVGTLGFGKAVPIWIWKSVSAGAPSKIDDPALFAFKFKIPPGGTGSGGSGGGGSGGNPPPTSDYKIAFAADWGCESATDDVIDLINSEGYDFVWGSGDNSYAGSASCWTSKFTALKNANKFDSAYGNHEYEESSGIGPYKTFLGHSLTYFKRQIQNILFLVIDSNINCDPGSPQHNAVTQWLEDADSDSSIVWKIALWHHPMFGASSQHSYNESDTVEAFMDLFIEHKVSFVVTGHNHNFQRTKQVARNPSSPTNPTIVQSAGPYSRNTAGLIHVVSGGGGHDAGSSLYSLGSQPSFQAYQSRTDNGVWEIVASNNGQTLTCQFRNTTGDVFDTFTITA